ncbi:hypothetical protein SLE2022_048960 [Rubroshorea leprosula]
MGAPYQYFGLRQGIPHSLSDPFEPEADEANAQPSREPEQIIESAGFPHHVGTYCVAETHGEYLPEKPSFSAQDLYQRYGIVPDVIPRDGVTAYETEYHTPQLPKERPSHPQGGLQYAYHCSYAIARQGGKSQFYSDPLQRTVPRSSSLVETNLPVPLVFIMLELLQLFVELWKGVILVFCSIEGKG